MLKCVFIIPALLAICLAYIMYSPLPPGLPVKARVNAGIHNLLDFTSIVCGRLGWHRGVVLRDLLTYMASGNPRPEDPSITARDHVFDGIPVHILTPRGSESSKRAVVYYHGGGWVAGDLDMVYHILLRTAKDLNAVVVYVEYRLAPEHVFPAAVDDCEKATLYFLQHAAEYGVDKNRIALMGDSAGGNLASVVSYRVHQKPASPQPKLQVLIYPMIESLTFDSPSYRWNRNGPIVTKDMFVYYPLAYLFGYNTSAYYNMFFSNDHTSASSKKQHADTLLNINALPNDQFLKDYTSNNDHGDNDFWDEIKTKLEDPSFCPLFGKDISAKSFPKTYISTCQYDVLRDEGYFYAQHLRSAGVDVKHVNLETCYHTWFGAFHDFEIFDHEFKQVMRYIETTL